MKKHLSTLFAFLFIVPCLFLLSACNKTQPTSNKRNFNFTRIKN